jgi:pimeloyl-ACP methyl ester carboxylesterase
MVELEGWGNRRSVQLAQGTISYRDLGAGPTLLFVHGLLANGTLWRDVVPPLAGNFRCIVPDMPLGGHSVAMNPEADLTPPGMAQIVADLMDVLDLHDVTLVGNDTGGAICQIVVATHPQRLAGLVLTNCDAYEAFFPWLISPFHYGARLLGERFTGALALALRHRPAQRLFLWTVARRRMDETTLDAYFASFVRDAGVRRDTARFLAAVSNRYTLKAARSFPSFRRPVLLVWGKDDLFFSSRLAHRLQRDFPVARLEFLSRSRAFVPEDRPDALATLIAGFVGER